MTRSRHHFWVSAPAIWAPVSVLGSAACVLALVGCNPLQPPPPLQPDSSATSALSLIVSPDPIALGTLAPGQSARATVTLRNTRDQTVQVKLETSCPCIRVTPIELQVEPRQSSLVIVVYDPADDPDFRGRLSVKLSGHEPSGQIAFDSRIEFEIRATTISGLTDPGSSQFSHPTGAVANGGGQ